MFTAADGSDKPLQQVAALVGALHPSTAPAGAPAAQAHFGVELAAHVCHAVTQQQDMPADRQDTLLAMLLLRFARAGVMSTAPLATDAAGFFDSVVQPRFAEARQPQAVADMAVAAITASSDARRQFDATLTYCRDSGCLGHFFTSVCGQVKFSVASSLMPAFVLFFLAPYRLASTYQT